MKTDPREELAKLQERYDTEKAPLINAVAELERIEAERKAAEAEKALATRRKEAEKIAEHLVTNVSAKADELLAELVVVLTERRDLARKLNARFSDIVHIGNSFEYSRTHETASADLVALWNRRKPDGRHETYAQLDARALNRLYSPKKAA